MEDKKDKIFKLIQNFLKAPPLIVWGSGATIPFGLPSMGDLNKKLKEEIIEFDTNSDNLEIELGKEKYQSILPEIKKVIWNEIAKADSVVLNKITSNNTTEFKGVTTLFESFLGAHPQKIDIVTTNYDRVLEYILSYNRINFTDGFIGKTLSSFDESLFSDKNIVNIIKVHGSLSWFNIEDETLYLNVEDCKYNPQIIAPGKNKYQEAYNSPYRELIQKADSAIKKAKSFLVVGFGFNDEHLTPKIKCQIRKGSPLVLITKKITSSTMEELQRANSYILLEEKNSNITRVVINNNGDRYEEELEGSYWKVSNFTKII